MDVWLNNPIRPLEASGTSGIKVAINGGLNLSILDGWWDEALTPNWVGVLLQEKNVMTSICVMKKMQKAFMINLSLNCALFIIVLKFQ